MANANPFRFSSKYQDDGTDLLYFGYRYYSVNVGVWISRDPISEMSFYTGWTGHQMFQERQDNAPPTRPYQDDAAYDIDGINEVLAGLGGLNGYVINNNDDVCTIDFLGLDPWCICIAADGGHAWIIATDLGTQTTTTYGRWKKGYGRPAADKSGVLKNKERNRKPSAKRCTQVQTFTPTINEGYNPRNNNCASYAASEWNRISGESLRLRGGWLDGNGYYDDPQVLVDSIKKKNGGTSTSTSQAPDGCCGSSSSGSSGS